MTAAPQYDGLAIEAEQSRRSLARFCREFWEVVEPGAALDWNWHIDAVCAHLEAVTRKEIQTLVIMMPPGHMKSLLVGVFWPAWEWLSRPTERGLFASHSPTVVYRDSRRMRAVVESDKYQSYVHALAPWIGVEPWKLASDQNAVKKFETTYKGFRQCVTVRGSVTGDRAHKIVMDDPYDASEVLGEPAKVKDRMEAVVEWWDKVMSSRLNDQRSGQKVIIMQCLHTDDLAAKEASREGTTVLCLPSDFDPTHPYVWRPGHPYAYTPDPEEYPDLVGGDPRTEEGEVLFPLRFPIEVLDRIEAKLGARQYAAQHGQRPVAKEGTLFKSAWWDEGRARYIQPPESIAKEAEQVGIFVDCQFKKKADADPVGALVFARTGPRRHLIDRRHGAKGIIETLAMLKPLYDYWLPRCRSLVLVIEDKANGDAVIELLRGELGSVIPFDPSPHGDKWTRAEHATWPARAGDIYLPDHGALADTVLAQWCGFPAMPHDEDVDCLSMMHLFWRHTTGASALMSEGGAAPSIMPTIEQW